MKILRIFKEFRIIDDKIVDIYSKERENSLDIRELQRKNERLNERIALMERMYVDQNKKLNMMGKHFGLEVTKIPPVDGTYAWKEIDK